jgi:hypothetical protein
MGWQGARLVRRRKGGLLGPVFTMTMLVIGGRESSAISIFFAAIFNLMFPRIGIGFA